MKSVEAHRYTSKADVPLFAAVDGAVVCHLDLGSWVGGVERDGDWLQVITAQHNGWLRLTDTVDSVPFTLSARFSNKVKGMIQNYIL